MLFLPQRIHKIRLTVSFESTNRKSSISCGKLKNFRAKEVHMNEEFQPCLSELRLKFISRSESWNSCWRFCRSLFHPNSSTVPDFLRPKVKDTKAFTIVSCAFGIWYFVEKDAVSSRSCLECVFLLQLYHRIGLKCSIASVTVLQIVPLFFTTCVTRHCCISQLFKALVVTSMFDQLNS